MQNLLVRSRGTARYFVTCALGIGARENTKLSLLYVSYTVVLLGINRCGSFPLLSALISNKSIFRSLQSHTQNIFQNGVVGNLSADILWEINRSAVVRFDICHFCTVRNFNLEYLCGLAERQHNYNGMCISRLINADTKRSGKLSVLGNHWRIVGLVIPII